MRGIEDPPICSADDVRLAWKLVNSNMYHGALQDKFGDDCWDILERIRDRVQLAAFEYGVDLYG